MGARSPDRYSRYNGAPAAAIGIYQSPGSNAVDVAKQVRDTMNTLATRFPADLTYNVFFEFNRIRDLDHRRSGAHSRHPPSKILVGIVVFLFLDEECGRR